MALPTERMTAIPASMLVVLILVCSGCSVADTPSISGKVTEVDTHDPIADAVVIATYTGRTRVRDMWFHAMTNLKATRCFRAITVTDSSGRFNIPATRLTSYFGQPTLRFKLYHSQFRSLADGISANAIDTYHEFHMWSESAAARYSIFSGGVIDYQRAHDPAGLKARQLDRNDYLATWLSYGGLVYPCDYEPAKEERENFLLDRFEDWLESVPNPDMPHHNQEACRVLAAFTVTPSDADRIARFRRIKEAAEGRCNKTSNSSPAF